MSRLLKALAWVAPGAAMSRARALMALDAARTYDGARRDRRTGGWETPAGSANVSIASGLAELRDRSHALARNSFIGSRTLDVLTANIVGTGITMKAATGSDRDDRKLDALFAEWCETSDIEGELDFAGQQALAVRAMLEGGDSLVRFVPRRLDGRRKVPLALQVMEGEHIDHLRDINSGGRRSLLGVVLGEWGVREGYWLHREHPSEWSSGNLSGLPLESQFVAKEDVAHLFQATRPGQVRGVPVFAPVLLDAKDLSDLRDAMVVKSRVEACFAGFVTSSDQTRTLAQAKSDSTASRKVVEELSPGMITYLQPGETVTFAQPSGSGQFEPVNLAAMMAVAAGVGITHDELTGDLRQANYSSLRAGRIISRRLVEQKQWLVLVPKLLRPLGRRFIDAAVMANLLRDKPTWRFEYVMPAVEVLDPKKDLEADVAAVRAGRMSPQQFIEAWGHDWRKVIADTEAFFKELDAKGVVLDIDPRRVTQTGIAQPQPAAAADGADPRDKPS